MEATVARSRLRVAGGCQFALGVLAVVAWSLLGFGVFACAVAGSFGSCHAATPQWELLGWAAAANVAAGPALMLSGSSAGGRWRRAAVGVSVGCAAFLAVAAVRFALAVGR